MRKWKMLCYVETIHSVIRTKTLPHLKYMYRVQLSEIYNNAPYIADQQVQKSFP